LHYEFIGHLVLLREVAFATSCDKIFRVVGAALGYRDDVIDCVGFHAAPIAFSSVSVKDTQTKLLPCGAVDLTL
jgi:hypothetical protein